MGILIAHIFTAKPIFWLHIMMWASSQIAAYNPQQKNIEDSNQNLFLLVSERPAQKPSNQPRPISIKQTNQSTPSVI